MFKNLALGMVVIASSGCTRKSDPQVHEIGLDSLARSHQIASSFSGKLVKLTIAPDVCAEYGLLCSVSGRDVHIHGTVPHTPPIVVFQLSPASSIPDPKQPFVILGKCGQPLRDGVWRSARCDYSVTLTDCLVAQPPP